LLWWVKNGPGFPPLVPLSPTLGLDPGSLTDLSVRGGAARNLNYGTFSGLRFSGGGWLDCDRVLGLEGSFLFTERRSASFRGAAVEPGALIPGLPATGPTTAGIVENSNTQLFGFEVNGLLSLAHDCSSHLELIAGFRNLDLNENLSLNAAATTTVAGVPTTAAFADAFRTQNQFWGPQIGARGGLRWGKLSADATLKVAMGVTHEVVNITGTRLVNFGGVLAPSLGGLYAEPTNIGRQTRDPFAVVPEVIFQVGYDVTRNVRVFVGYDFLYVSSVARPGNQVDPVLNTSQLVGPLVGPPRPARFFKDSDFWAQGLNFGVQFSY
jgi:hypothetical protein